MSQTPEIKPEVTGRHDEEERRGGGFLGFLSRLGGGGGGGAAGGVGAGGAAGGILATKAGIIGLALVGTTVAAGIGLVGYKAMSPTSSASNTYSIFDAKPKQAAVEGGEAGAAGQAGAAGSLQMFANANAPAEPEKPAEAAPVDPKASASASAAASKAVDHGNASLSGPAAAMPKSQLAGKIGGLGGTSGGSGSSANFSAGSASSQYSSVRQGRSGAMSRQAGARPSGTSLGAPGARGVNGLKGLARQIRRDQIGARSSAGAGRTWDGNGARNATFGADAGGISDGGAGLGQGMAADGLGSPEKLDNEREQKDPPPVEPKEVTPWEKELGWAKNLLMIGAGVLFAACMLKKSETATAGTTATLIRVLAVLGGLCAAAAMVLGFMTLGGKHGQGVLGTVIGLAGGLLTAVSIGILTMGTDALDKGDLLGQFEPWMTICGVAGLAGVVGTFFLKPTKLNCKDDPDFKDCKDSAMIILDLRDGAPSDRALDQFHV